MVGRADHLSRARPESTRSLVLPAFFAAAHLAFARRASLACTSGDTLRFFLRGPLAGTFSGSDRAEARLLGDAAKRERCADRQRLYGRLDFLNEGVTLGVVGVKFTFEDGQRAMFLFCHSSSIQNELMCVGNLHEVTVMRVIGLVALLVCASAAVAQLQVPAPASAPPQVGTGAISGVVTDGQTGSPIAGALVQLVTSDPMGAAPSARARQMTDGRGPLRLSTIGSRLHTVRVTAPDYLDGGFGRVPGTEASSKIAIEDRQWFGEANTMLWKPASIYGTIRDERGEPLVDVPVTILMAV